MFVFGKNKSQYVLAKILLLFDGVVIQSILYPASMAAVFDKCFELSVPVPVFESWRRCAYMYWQ